MLHLQKQKEQRLMRMTVKSNISASNRQRRTQVSAKMQAQTRIF